MTARAMVAGWLAGLVLGLSQAWWPDIGTSLFALCCGAGLTGVAWIAARDMSRHERGKA